VPTRNPRSSDEAISLPPIELKTAAQTRRVGAILGRLLQAGDVLGLDGPLGAGKTCLVQGLAAGLGVPRGTAVSSPTFTLVNQYEGRLPLFHVDLYRLEDAGELAELGLWEAADAGGVLAVEWLSRFPHAVPADRLQLELEHAPGGGRRLSISALGPGAARRLEELGAALAKGPRQGRRTRREGEGT
jgi:tRNA threonylcarbamoyladenosine biosynthesis protein TsaE